MDYSRHYTSLVDRAKTRVLAGYVERHHIVPRCMGGGDERTNIVRLTPEEHFVAHQLLMKMHPQNDLLAFATHMMTVGKYRSNRAYGWVRRRFSDAMSALPRSKEHMSACHAGRRAKGTSEEHRKLISEALAGKKKSQTHREALSVARRAMVYTPELREKLAANKGKKLNATQYAAFVLHNKGKALSEELKEKLRKPKGPQVRVTCTHCGKSGGQSLMHRWHFDKCKEKQNV